MENVSLTGIDLSKEVFEVRCENHAGRLVSRREVRRGGMVKLMTELPKGSLVAMEACGSSQYWAHEFMRAGLRVKLFPPQRVRAFRTSQKNDVNDAEAICTTARQPGIRAVSVKTYEQLEIQMMHRVKERLGRDSTALINQIRGFLLERGFVIPRGVSSFRKKVQEILGGIGAESAFGAMIQSLWEEYVALEQRLAQCLKAIKRIARENPECRKIEHLAGVGPVTATAAVATIGRPQDYKNGRQFAASVGLVPKQFSSGGKIRLGSITKCGDPYLRKNLVHGARAAVRAAVKHKKTDPLSLWIRALHERSDTNTTTVALANKTARRIWAILAGKELVPECQLAQAA